MKASSLAALTNKEDLLFPRSLFAPSRMSSSRIVSRMRLQLWRRGGVAVLLLLCLIDPVSSFSVEQRMRQRGTHLSSSSSDSSSEPSAVRFLGHGPRAIVREGSVLVAPQHEYHHYYRQSAIFVYDMGEDHDQQEGGLYVIRGLILDHPTPFTLKEMIPGKFDDSALGESLLFRGGDKGGDGVVLLHSRPGLGQPEIGGSGIYQGGWDAALAAIEAGEADVDDFKAFFNYCEFSEDELEELLESQEDGDGWASVEVGYDVVLDKDWDRGDCWKRLRNAVSQQMRA